MGTWKKHLATIKSDGFSLIYAKQDRVNNFLPKWAHIDGRKQFPYGIVKFDAPCALILYRNSGFRVFELQFMKSHRVLPSTIRPLSSVSWTEFAVWLEEEALLMLLKRYKLKEVRLDNSIWWGHIQFAFFSAPPPQNFVLPRNLQNLPSAEKVLIPLHFDDSTSILWATTIPHHSHTRREFSSLHDKVLV